MRGLNTSIIILAVLTILASTVIVFATQPLDLVPPPPTTSPSRNQAPPPPQSQISLSQASDVPPPPTGRQTTEAPPPPPPKITAEDASRELTHAYNDLQEVQKLVNIAGERDLNVERAYDVIGLAVSFYNKALEYYNTGDYLKTVVYSHLSCEASHGAHEIITRIFAENSISMPPPSPPTPPLP